MQSKNTFFGAFIVVGLLSLLACAPAPVAIKEKLPPSPEFIQALERFKTADDLFEQQAYSEAMAIYQDHLRRFPMGPLGDTALMKTGLIREARITPDDLQQFQKVVLINAMNDLQTAPEIPIESIYSP